MVDWENSTDVPPLLVSEAPRPLPDRNQYSSSAASSTAGLTYNRIPALVDGYYLQALQLDRFLGYEDNVADTTQLAALLRMGALTFDIQKLVESVIQMVPDAAAAAAARPETPWSNGWHYVATASKKGVDRARNTRCYDERQSNLDHLESVIQGNIQRCRAHLAEAAALAAASSCRRQIHTDQHVASSSHYSPATATVGASDSATAPCQLCQVSSPATGPTSSDQEDEPATAVADDAANQSVDGAAVAVPEPTASPVSSAVAIDAFLGTLPEGWELNVPGEDGYITLTSANAAEWFNSPISRLALALAVAGIEDEENQAAAAGSAQVEIFQGSSAAPEATFTVSRQTEPLDTAAASSESTSSADSARVQDYRDHLQSCQ